MWFPDPLINEAMNFVTRENPLPLSPPVGM
jgi:hypothetical protein